MLLAQDGVRDKRPVLDAARLRAPLPQVVRRLVLRVRLPQQVQDAVPEWASAVLEAERTANS